VAFQVLHQTTTAPAAGGRATDWKLAKCPECGGVIVAEIRADGGRGTELGRVFPDAAGQWAVEGLSGDVAMSWAEAIAVYEGAAHHAAVVMCGRTLEAAAHARDMSGGTLHQQINQMLIRGLITSEFKGAMTYTRLIRNVGAHAGKAVSPESAEGAMRFTQQTLRLLFEVPAQLARLDPPRPEELRDSDD
jgi:hypothetical protein